MTRLVTMPGRVEVARVVRDRYPAEYGEHLAGRECFVATVCGTRAYADSVEEACDQAALALAIRAA